jgi:hypothetical protein
MKTFLSKTSSASQECQDKRMNGFTAGKYNRSSSSKSTDDFARARKVGAAFSDSRKVLYNGEANGTL